MTRRGTTRLHTWRLWALAVLVCAGACSDLSGSAEPDGPAGVAPTDDGGEAGPVQSAIESNVEVIESGHAVPADLAGPSAELVTLQEGPYVAAAVYPRPDYEGNPWSQWGQGIALDDGRVITGIGDHLGVDANSYVFVYDPEAGTLTRFADVLSALDHQPGSWGYGKIHGQMVDAGDGGVYFTTYYGSRDGINFDGSYQGDVLFRVDIETLELAPVAVPVPVHGVPSLASDGAGRIYGEAVDPLLDDSVYPAGGFFVFDTVAGETTRFSEDPQHELFRNIMVDSTGTAWYAGQGGSLFSYDPAADEIGVAGFELPGSLRASTHPATDGTVYGVTDEPSSLFAVEAGGNVRTLGSVPSYIASVALTPDESAFLYVPGAHGDAYLEQAPLIAVDTATGEQTTIVELDQLARDQLGLVLGGTYSITTDPARGHAHIGFNAGESEEDPWGEVVFVVVELP